MRLRLSSLGVVASAVLATASPAAAQVDFGSSYGISLGSDLTNGAMMGSAYGRGGTSRRPQPSGPVLGSEAEHGLQRRLAESRACGFSATVPATASTRYRADPAVTERVKRQYIDFMARQAPGDVDRARGVIGRIDLARVWSQGVAHDGLRPGDVADAMASYWVLNWAIANGGDNTREQMLAVRRNLQPIIASSPSFTRLPEAQRQEMAEALMINFLVQRDVYMRAVQTHDEPLLARLRSAAVTRFQREGGVDLRRIALTNQGFRPRG